MTPVQGYNKANFVTSSERQLEAQALTHVALLMNQALIANDRDALVGMVTLNNRLWLFFYSQIESKQVILPPDVEKNIVNLVAYIMKVAPMAFSGDVNTIRSLVSINHHIAAGLSEGPADDARPSESATLSVGLSA
ncbi:MAG TPA: hypothetical protein HPQ04_11575 [Rhodospirillaceae bacterium]|nr:hypothetical protein [Rhodospirillaceae bacterium]